MSHNTESFSLQGIVSNSLDKEEKYDSNIYIKYVLDSFLNKPVTYISEKVPEDHRIRIKLSKYKHHIINDIEYIGHSEHIYYIKYSFLLKIRTYSEIKQDDIRDDTCNFGDVTLVITIAFHLISTIPKIRSIFDCMDNITELQKYNNGIYLKRIEYVKSTKRVYYDFITEKANDTQIANCSESYSIYFSGLRSMPIAYGINKKFPPKMENIFKDIMKNTLFSDNGNIMVKIFFTEIKDLMNMEEIFQNDPESTLLLKELLSDESIKISDVVSILNGENRSEIEPLPILLLKAVVYEQTLLCIRRMHNEIKCV